MKSVEGAETPDGVVHVDEAHVQARSYHAPKTLRPRHHEIIRLHFQGLPNMAIASQVGVSPTTVTCILRSPLAQGELARLKKEAEDKLTDIPAKARLINEIQGFGVESLRHNRELLRDKNVDVKLRARIAQHGMDRVLFGRNGDDEEKKSIRDILRRLDDVADQLKNSKLTPVTVIEVEASGTT